MSRTKEAKMRRKNRYLKTKRQKERRQSLIDIWLNRFRGQDQTPQRIWPRQRNKLFPEEE